jgi:hypothetical protein
VRFIAAIVSFVIAFGMIAFGIAQRTVFAEANSVTKSATTTSEATVTLIDSSTLRALPGRQDVTITGPGNVFAAYGRTADVLAWVGNTQYNRIGYDKATGKLTHKVVPGKATKVPDPAGSDLWLDEFSRGKNLEFTVNVPEGITVILVSDGKKPAPDHIAVTWPLDNRTPWAGPLITGGILLLLVGGGLYIWAWRHLRRSRGPRRKTPKMPKVPRQRGYRRPKTRSAAAPGRRSTKRRMVAVVPLVLVALLALSGCSPDLWPDFSGGGKTASPTPVISKTPAAADDQAPAVTPPQLTAIIAKVTTVATKADTDKDATLLATRFTGPALALRTANYAIRKADPTAQPLAAIPTGSIRIDLPQQSNTWPRTTLAVVQSSTDKTVAPVALMLVQQTPRDDYKVEYATPLEAKVVFPKVAPANIGAVQFSPENKFQVIQPGKLALAYGDLIEKGSASEYANLFDMKKDDLLPAVGQDFRKGLVASTGAQAALTFANSNGPGSVIALGSNDSGAIVAVELNETYTAKPTEAGAAVNPEGLVKTLLGLSSTTKGTTAVYSDQLLFYVPRADSKMKVTLLGFASGLVSAKELS